MAYNKYGEPEEEAAERSRRAPDRTAWSRRPISDAGLTFGEFCERERRREQHRGDPATEAELVAQWDRMYPNTASNKPSVDARIALKDPYENPRKSAVESAQDIGRPTR